LLDLTADTISIQLERTFVLYQIYHLFNSQEPGESAVASRNRKKRRLDAAVLAIQRRWGSKALRRGQATTTASIPHIPTGFPTLDKALGIGGIPRSRITEMLGAPTSGMATLALKVLANAQARGDIATYIDLSYTFDPDYASRCGVNSNKLLLVRPHSGVEALEILYSLIASRGTGVLVFNSTSHLITESHGPQALSTALRRLTGGLAQAPCALVFLTSLHFGDAVSLDNYPSGFALPHYAAVRLLIEKEQWIKKRRDVRGYRARVTVIKNKLGSSGKSASIAITFNGVVDGNGT
jgi:recombination protein RecA